MATLLADSFTRADSTNVPGSPTTGGPYTVRVGTWGISSNQMYISAATAESVITAPTATDVDFTATLSGSDTSLSILHRWIDANNYILLQHNAGGVQAYRKAGGTFAMRSSNFVAPAGLVSMPTTLRMVCVGRVVQCFCNGYLIAQFEDDGATMPGVSGYRLGSNTLGRIDDVTIVDATALSVIDSVGVDTTGSGFDNDLVTVDSWAYRGRDRYSLDAAAVA